MSNRYRGESFSRCVSCTRRWAGDTCRFQGIRYLLRGPDKKVAIVSFRENHQTNEPPFMEFPTVWNRKFKKEHVTRIKMSIAKALLPTLKLERTHLNAKELVRRPRESEVRATCDTCMTSLFSASWMCRTCGREVCYECFLQVKELTSEPSSASPAELAALQGKREKHAHSNPFFLSCNKRAEHGVGEFTPVTRFWDKELEKAIKEMEDILEGTEGGTGGKDMNGIEDSTSSRWQEDIRRNGRSGYDSNDPLSSPLSSPPHSDPAVPTPIDGVELVYDSYLPSNLSPRIASIPVHKLQQIPASLYDPIPSPPPSPSHTSNNNASRPPSSRSRSSSVAPPPSFASLWARGFPILVKDVLPRFKLSWTPEYFIQQYGEQNCLIIECQTDMNKRISVGEFFGMFGKYEGRTQCWKLKDWPPSTDFKTAFPGLYEDFSQAVPVPDYVRRDGVFNLGSHFPSNTIAPDLGPKMYNSLASSQEPGSKGSTRLHMDMADALNVMLYASKCEDGTEGYAAWDLFRAEDSDKLRAFLRRKFGQPQNGGLGLAGMGGGGGGNSVMPIAHDPIHGQQFYLDVELRQALYDECGVMSYRVYQRPGDGVFIPAGCAHQVANMSDCMKIAIDFVSPENIDRCEKLTREFREQNQSKVWKEDVLQLRTMMWFAWQSCSLQDIQYKQDYHSTKQEMFRIAADSNTASKQIRPSQPPTTYRRATSRLSYNEFEILEPSEESDLDDLFFTPNTSPRTSMASSLLMFPTGRKPSRKSLRLSDASDIVLPAPPTPAGSINTITTAPSRTMPGGLPPSTNAPTAVLSTRTPSTTASSSHHSSARDRRQNDAQNQRTTSLEPGGGGSSSGTHHLESGNDRRKGKEGVKYTTRHGTAMLKPNTVVVPSTITTITQMQSVKTTTTSKRKSTDGGDTKDVKRPVPPSVSTPTPTPTSSTPNGIAVKTTVTTTTSASTTTSATIGSPHVFASRKSSKPKPHTNPAAAGSSKEKTKQDMAVEPEAPSAGKTKEKEKDLDASTSKSRVKDTGKEKAKTTSMPTTQHGDGNAVISEQSTNTPPKTTTPHTFSAFAPLTASTTPTAPLPEKTNGNGNGNAQDKPPLPPAGFSFPPPPLHSPQHLKNSLNGSAAAYTYAHRQKGGSTTKPPPPVGSSSIMMNMAALLEEDEIDGDGNTQMRKLRRTTNGNAKGKGKEKRSSFDSMSSASNSSHHSHSRSPPQSNGGSNSIPNSNSNATTSQTHTHTRSESSTFRSPPKTLSSEVNSMSLSTPGELPSKGTQGYTSLVLPRAPVPLRSHSTSIRTASTSGSGSQRKWFGKEGKIDLTRSGVAQTTMASVEVVRGLGKQQGQNGFGGKLLGMFGRKRSISASGRGDVGPRPIEGLGKAVDDTRIVNEAKGKASTTAEVESTVLGFTSYRKPPGYVPSNSVLVQVWAVGVDGIDGRLVGLRFGDHIWSRVREREVIGSGSGYEEEGGVETEWEREREMEGNEENEEVDVSKSTPQQNSNNRGLAGLGRSFSLRMSRTKQPPNRHDHQRVHGRQEPSRSYTDPSQPQQNTFPKQVQRPKVLEKKQKRASYATHKAEVGYIPGRSFVGRVLECGWDVRDEVVRKGEWVVGLLDVKKCGALTEFIVVDRHRIHRIPHPLKVPQRGNGHLNAATEAGASMPFQEDGSNMSALTLEELALLPLCGIPAYRAVRTFIYAFSSLREGVMASPTTGAAVGDRKGGGGVEFGNRRNSKLTTEHPQDRRRRVLVLRGHDGVGAMAVQMLAKRGWKVSVHVPFSSSFVSDDAQPTTTRTTEAEEHDSFPRDIQGRARDWGADEIIFDEEAGGGIDDGRIAAIRVIESLREDGDVFDAILDTVGGKEVREAGERLLRSAGGGGEPMSPRTPNKAKGVGQFTTLVGDVPERPIPTAGDNFRAGLRSLRFGSNDGSGGAGNADAGNGDESSGGADMKGNKVGYAWVSVAQDVDWEGEDIGDTLASVLRLALEDGVRPVIGDDVANHHRVVPFEKAPYAFVDKGPLGHGHTVVVKIAG